MTEYERLKEEIIAIALLYTGDAKALTTRLMTIIADKCWLKDNKHTPTCPYHHFREPECPYERAQRDMLKDGFRPVIEIKKEAK